MEFLNKIVWHNQIRTYLLAGGILLASMLLALILTKVLRKYVISGAQETEGRLDDLMAEIGARPIALLLILAGLHAATYVLLMPPWIHKILWSLFVVAWTVVGTVFTVRLITGFLTHYVERFADEHEAQLYKTLILTIRSSVRVIIWLVAAVFIVSNLGFNVSSVLAGLGLGGLALALAAKDTLSNIFGSFTILVNGPYRVGEAVKYQGHAGAIESIGLRDTKLRTWDGHLVVVPNSLAPTSVVENISRRPSFRCLFKLGLHAGTSSQKMSEAKEIIKKSVTDVEGTTEDIRIHFLEWGESTVDLQVIYFITDFVNLLNIRDEVNCAIKAGFEAAGIEIAYKTITVKQS